MKGRVIAVGGPPGSGKTTLAVRLAKILGRRHYSAGELFRLEATRRSMDLLDFSAIAEKDERIDIGLDEKMILLASPTVLLEGRIIGELLKERLIPVFRIRITASDRVRAARIAQRDGLDYKKALFSMQTRAASERSRYLKYYGLDVDRLGCEIEVDTSNLDPERTLQRTLQGLAKGDPLL